MCSPAGSSRKRRILRAAGASFAPAATAYRSAHGRLGSVEPLKRRRRPGLEARRPGGTPRDPGPACVELHARPRSIEERRKTRLVERDVSGGRRQRRKQIGRRGVMQRPAEMRLLAGLLPRRRRRRRDVIHRLRGAFRFTRRLMTSVLKRAVSRKQRYS